MSDLAQKIRAVTIKALADRNRYSDKVTVDLSRVLNKAEEDVAKAILKYRSLGSLSENKLAALKGLEKLKAEIKEIGKKLNMEQSLIFRQATNKSFKLGISGGIKEFVHSALPFYKDLNPDGIERLATKVFSIINTNGLDFMLNYNLTLAGDVQRELTDSIQRTILNGIITGKGTDDIVRDLGKVVLDKDSFRQAGSKTFSKAQYRMEMIARTEIIRAHNMGRQKFHQQVGVKKLEWLAMGDERMCPVCKKLNGKVFPVDKFPPQPSHPHCRCVQIPVISSGMEEHLVSL